MKFLILILIIGLNSLVFSQNCDMYFPLEKGKSWVVSNYNKKGKLESEQLNTIVSKETTSEGEKAIVKIEVIDQKKKEDNEVEITYNIECNGDLLLMDMQMYIPQEQTETAYGSEVKIEMSNIEFPNNLKIGQNLEDASITVTMTSTNMAMFTVNIVDRKVEGIENITTSAGTFECYKISQTAKIKILFMNITATTTTYFSKGVGVVRTENYSKKGKLTDYSELTKIN